MSLSESDYKLAKKIKEKNAALDKSHLQKKRKEKQEDREFMKKADSIFVNDVKSSTRFEETKEDIQQFQRSSSKIQKRDEKMWQLHRKKRNRMTDVRKAKWSLEDREKQYVDLAEVEVLRKPVVASGIEIGDEDVQVKTDELDQEDILEAVNLQAQKKVFDIMLERSAGYIVSYNESGRHMLILGKTTGLISSIEWRKFNQIHELKMDDRIFDAVWMMDDAMYAVAQQKFTYVYDDEGEMIHIMRDFPFVRHLQYLPYHFLLVGADRDGLLRYKDVTLGETIAQIQLPPITCMGQNPFNAVIVCGHSNGQISMVTPRDRNSEPTVSMQCHKSAISHVSVDSTGTYMITCSVDGIIKVWEIKESFKAVQTYQVYDVVQALTMSQSGMLAIGTAGNIRVWKHPSEINENNVYLRHSLSAGQVTSLNFCPFEDVLAIGHTDGLSSILVPGSGVSEFDSRIANPFSTDKSTKHQNVNRLLEKIPANMITLNPNVIGTSGLSEKTLNYEKGVDMTSGLKKKLNEIGIHEKKEQVKIAKLSKEEIRVHKEEINAQHKVKVPAWFEDPDANPLDRFQSFANRKRKYTEEQKDPKKDKVSINILGKRKRRRIKQKKNSS